MEPNIYEIKTLDDFQKVPEDRLEDCLSEFKTVINMQRGMIDLTKAVGEGIGIPPEFLSSSMPSFTWVDDGKKDVTISVGEATHA